MKKSFFLPAATLLLMITIPSLLLLSVQSQETKTATDLILGGIKETGSAIYGELISSLIDLIFGNSDLQQIIEMLEQVMIKLDEIAAFQFKLLEEIRLVSIEVQRTIMREELFDAVAWIRTLSTEQRFLFSRYQQTLQDTMAKGMTTLSLQDSSEIQANITLLQGKIAEHIPWAVERLYLTGLPYLDSLRDNYVENYTDIITVSLNLNQALNYWSNQLQAAQRLLLFAQRKYPFVEATLNNSLLYEEQLKSWQNRYVVTSLVPMMEALVENGIYEIPHERQLRETNFNDPDYCLDFNSEIDSSDDQPPVLFRVIPQPAVGEGCQGRPVVKIQAVEDFDLADPFFNILVNDLPIGWNREDDGKCKLCLRRQLEGEASISDPYFEPQRARLIHPKLNLTNLRTEDRLNYFMIQFVGTPQTIGDDGSPARGPSYWQRATVDDGSQNVFTADYWNQDMISLFSIAPDAPTLQNVQGPGTQASPVIWASTFTLFDDLGLGLTVPLNNLEALQLDYLTGTRNTSENMWIFSKVVTHNTYVIIHRETNRALSACTPSGSDQDVVAIMIPLQPINNAGYYNGNYLFNELDCWINQEWLLQNSTTNPIRQPWNQTIITSQRKNTTESTRSLTIPVTYSGVPDFTFDSFPLQMVERPLQVTDSLALSQRFVMGNYWVHAFPNDLWEYYIASWLNGLKVIGTDKTDVNAKLLSKLEAPVTSDLTWVARKMGGTSGTGFDWLFYQKNVTDSYCLTANNAVDVTLRRCVFNSVPDTHRWKVTRDPNLANVGYTIENRWRNTFLTIAETDQDQIGLKCVPKDQLDPRRGRFIFNTRYIGYKPWNWGEEAQEEEEEDTIEKFNPDTYPVGEEEKQETDVTQTMLLVNELENVMKIDKIIDNDIEKELLSKISYNEASLALINDLQAENERLQELLANYALLG